MKRLFKKIISVFLGLMCAFSCVACTKDSIEKVQDEYPRRSFTGIHNYTATDTDNYLVQNGKTNYKIVVPDGTLPTRVNKAKTEFVYLFAQATGITLDVVTDAGLTHNSNDCYISIGETNLLDTSGIVVDKKYLSDEGVRIVTKGKTIFLFGGGDFGTLYSVYTFMEQSFHMDQYTGTIISIDKVTDFKLKQYDITDIPDMRNRANSHGYLKYKSSDYNQNNYSSRMRYYENYLRVIPVYKYLPEQLPEGKTNPTNTGHNSSSHVLPMEVYKADYPEWFSTRGNQLCYTARGNAEKYALMVDEALKKLQYCIEMNPKSKLPLADQIVIGITDNRELTCRCDACFSNMQKYGVESASVVMFINDVADKLKDWMESLPDDTPYKRDDLKLLLYAYYEFTYAPAKRNEKTGEYEPIDEKVRFRDNVGVVYANIDTNYQNGLFTDDNQEFYHNALGWGALGGAGIYYYLYDNNYHYQFHLYDSFNFFTTETYQFMASLKVGEYYMLSQSTVPTLPTAWNALKIYLDSKLSWNASLSNVELTEKWFKGVYKDVWKVMKGIFDDTRLHYISFCEQYGMNRGYTVYINIQNTKYWPLAVIDNFISRYDEALELAKKYQISAPDTYDKICSHIEIECISMLVLKAKLYWNDISVSEQTKLKERIKKDIEWLDIGELDFKEGYPKETLQSFVDSL